MSTPISPTAKMSKKWLKMSTSADPSWGGEMMTRNLGTRCATSYSQRTGNSSTDPRKKICCCCILWHHQKQRVKKILIVYFFSSTNNGNRKPWRDSNSGSSALGGRDDHYTTHQKQRVCTELKSSFSQSFWVFRKTLKAAESWKVCSRWSREKKTLLRTRFIWKHISTAAAVPH
jgi:hypothetical protein